jgi:protocatechuate 3,4-dioxygenase beta subunit
MNHIAYNLLRLSLLATLVLALGGSSVAGAQAPQQSSPFPCQPAISPGKITGTVRDSNGEPLPGVEVRAYPTTGAATQIGETDAAGQYGISLPPASYLLEFKPSHGHYQAAWYKSGTLPLDANPVEVGDGKTVSGIDVKLLAGAQFNVTLRNPEGTPVEQGLISVFDRYDRKVAEGQTNAEGRTLTVPGLPPGSYRMFARPPYGSPLLAHYLNQKPTLNAADVLTVTQAISVDVPITLQPGAQLNGTVTDASTGAPLPGIAVEIQNTDGESRYAMTNAQGRYSLEGLASGAYEVEFRPSQPKPSAPASLRRLITLSAPNAHTGFDVALTSGGAISGRVTTPDGTPIADVSIKVRDRDGAFETYTTTEADGTYSIHGLPSGRYTLAYSHNNYQPLAPTGQVEVTAPNTTTQTNTVLHPGGAISGKVTDPDGKPLAGVYVAILDAATGKTQDSYGYTDAAGIYTIAATLPNGSYVVKFQPPLVDGGCPLAIEYSGNAATAAAATRVQVSAANTVSGIDAELAYGGLIGGQITDAGSGLPLYGTVQVYDATGALVVKGVSGMLGHYRTIAGLPAGSYRVQFVADNYVAMFYGGSTALEAAARVPSGVGEINMVRTRGGAFAGRVTAEDTGAPLEHAAVTLYGPGNRVVATQLTAFDGSYRFPSNLPNGQYRIGAAPGKRDDGTPYFTGYEAVFSGGARDLASAQPLTVVAPKTVNVNLDMPATQIEPPPPPPPPPGSELVYLPLVTR